LSGVQSVSVRLPSLVFRDSSISVASVIGGKSDLIALAGKQVTIGQVSDISNSAQRIQANFSLPLPDSTTQPSDSGGFHIVNGQIQNSLVSTLPVIEPTPIPYVPPPIVRSDLPISTTIITSAPVQQQSQFVMAGYSKEAAVRRVNKVDRDNQIVADESQVIYPPNSMTGVSARGSLLAHKSNQPKKIQNHPNLTDSGDADIVRVMSAPGFAVYGWFSGNTRIETNNGSIVTQLHNGAKVTKLGNGSTITEFKDGSTMTEVGGVAIRTFPDGTIFTDYKNGTTSTKYKDGTTVLQTPDGCMVASYPDGTRVDRQPDGTITTTYSNGKKVITGPMRPVQSNKIVPGSDAEAPPMVPERQKKSDNPGQDRATLCLPVGHLILAAPDQMSIKMVEGTAHVAQESGALC
jgi:hypothetical protein